MGQRFVVRPSMTRAALGVCLVLAFGVFQRSAVAADAPTTPAAPSNATPRPGKDRPSATTAARLDVPLVVISGERIGPVAIGMTHEDLQKLGLTWRDVPPHALSGPYTVAFDERGRVMMVSVVLNGTQRGVSIDSKLFPPSASARELIAAAAPCERPSMGFGGSLTFCRGGRLVVAQAGPQALTEIRVYAEDLSKH